MNCLKEIICEAKCCATDYAAKFADSLTFGRTQAGVPDYDMLMMYIDVLERNYPYYIELKEKVAIVPQKIQFSSLTKQNNNLHLNIEEKVVCREVKIDPCLPDSDLIKIVEIVKTFCSTCDCNCK